MGFKSQYQNVLMEIAIMKKLTHPSLIQLYEVIDYDEGDKLYMGKFGRFSISSDGLCRAWRNPEMELENMQIQTL